MISTEQWRMGLLKPPGIACRNDIKLLRSGLNYSMAVGGILGANSPQARFRGIDP